MAPLAPVKILFVEQDTSVWPRAEAFFLQQLAQVGALGQLQFRPLLPGRAAGFDIVSLAGSSLVATLLDKPDLLTDFQQTPILNLHAEAPGLVYGQLRRLLGRGDRGLHGSGLWVFPQSWMAPWFEECLEFPELGLSQPRPPQNPPALPDRSWERRTARLTLQAYPCATLG